MADNSSNMVAIVAIIVIVLLGLAGYYFYANRQVTTSTVDVSAPVSTPATTTN